MVALKYFLFLPLYTWGNDPISLIFFEMDWFNHQLELFVFHPYKWPYKWSYFTPINGPINGFAWGEITVTYKWEGFQRWFFFPTGRGFLPKNPKRFLSRIPSWRPPSKRAAMTQNPGEKINAGKNLPEVVFYKETKGFPIKSINNLQFVTIWVSGVVDCFGMKLFSEANQVSRLQNCPKQTKP